MSTAITWFFEHVEQGIILEDDCLPDLSFFQYCNELLEYYKLNDKVGMISGNNYQSFKTNKKLQFSYYFSIYPHTWGWATWMRVWKQYDVNLTHWNGDLETYSDVMQNPAARKRFSSLMTESLCGKFDTWDYQFVNLMITKGFFSITPSRNLVENIGFDERATHTKGGANFSSNVYPMQYPLVHPCVMEADQKADKYLEIYIYKIYKNYLHKKIIKLKSFLLKLLRY